MGTSLESRTAEYLTVIPDTGTAPGRQAWLYVVFGDAGFLASIDYEGAPREFCRRLVERLDRYGALPDGSDALEVLLAATETVDVGLEDRRTCDELIAAWRLRHRGRRAPDLPESPPYKGLAFYDTGDAGLFFGRDRLTAQLVTYLCDHSLLAVVGASGSGKSSLVRAGLVPALRTGKRLSDDVRRPAGGELWPLRMLTPTARPLEALAVALIPSGERTRAITDLLEDMAADPRCLHLYVRQQLAQNRLADRLLLVVDQFEELFTLCRDRIQRKAFVDNVLNAAMPDGVITVILTLRADFYAHCAEFDNLRLALERCQRYIGAMSQEELRLAIEAPAGQGGWDLEPGLVDLMLGDVADEPGALPLLSHALLETWKRRSGRTLTLAGYQASGRVQGAIAKTADSTFAALTPGQQAVARSIFLRLTELGEGVQDTRRRVPLQELVPGPEAAADVQAVLQTLENARLLTTVREIERRQGADGVDGEALPITFVDVAHEALIREWPALREWLADDREGLRMHRRLTEAASEWQRMLRDPSVLYRGTQLDQILEWTTAHPIDLNELERAFIDASREQADLEERAREQARRHELEQAQALTAEAEARVHEEAKARNFLRGLLIAVLALLIAAIAATWVISGQNEQLTTEKQNADTARATAVSDRATADANAQLARQAGLMAQDARATAVANLGLAQQRLMDLEGESHLKEARELKRALDPQGAIGAFRAAATADPSLGIDVSAEISDTLRYVATRWVAQGEELLRLASDTESAAVRQQATISATALFGQALALSPPPDTPIYVRVPPGEFTMGSTEAQLAVILAQNEDRKREDYADETPSHLVRVDAFWIMRTEVTYAQYVACMEAGVCKAPNNTRWQQPQFANHPVIGVNWHQAKNYAGWVGGRLPTEAEWELACRGIDGRIYPWGNQEPSPALLNYPPAGLGIWAEVGSYPKGASAHGLLDMAGNAWEWTEDWFDPEYYAASPGDNPTGPVDEHEERTLRGGAFVNDNVHCAYRDSNAPDRRGLVGLRVVIPGSSPH